MSFLLFVACGLSEVSDLPFDDDPNSDPIPVPSPSPTPSPSPIRPFSQILGIPELFAAAILLSYLLFYFIGSHWIESAVRRASRSAAAPLRKYFYVVPDLFQRITTHEFHSWVTGRKGYLGLFVRGKFTMKCDPIGWFFDKVIGRGNRLVFEFVCEPEPEQCGVFSLRYNALDYVKELKMAKVGVSEMGLNLFTDFGDAKEVFLNAIIGFHRRRPGVIWSVDLANTNRFETSVGGRIVARLEFTFREKFEDFVNEELIDFVMGIADQYVSLRLPEGVIEANVRHRAEVLTGRKFKRD
jgi:hypothetical protein